jgi:hypothetical protein
MCVTSKVSVVLILETLSKEKVTITLIMKAHVMDFYLAVPSLISPKLN